MNILILREADIRRACTMPEAIDAACEALRLYSAGVCDIPLRTTIAVPEGPGSSLYMYGYAAPAGALGVKIVSSFPENAKRGLPSTPSTMVLLDAQTGAVCALLDGTYFTRLRTGALAGAATRLLARQDSRVFTIYGTGGQALEQIEAVLAVRPIERVQIVGRSRDKAAALARQVQAAHGAFCTADVPADEAAANADIITAVTGAYTPLFDGALVRPGTHINGIGSCTPQQAELDVKLITRAGKIYADTLDGVLHEAGDLMQALVSGAVTEEHITGELGQLILGRTPGRESADEITFFDSTGTAALDLVTAKRIYDRAQALHLGDSIEL